MEQLGVRIGWELTAPLLFSALCGWAFGLSPWAERGLAAFEDYGTPSLRALAVAAPWILMVQVALGVTLRNQLMGPLAHIVGALTAGAFVLYFSTGVLTPAPARHPARTLAMVLLWATVAQILLGVAAYAVRYSKPSTMPDTIAFTAAHYALAAIVLAATLVLSRMLLRCVRIAEAAKA